MGVSRLVTRALLAGMLLLGVIAVAPAAATDNSTVKHWHNRNVEYKLNQDLPSKARVVEAAQEWARDTKLELFRGSNVNHTDPSLAGHIVWRGTIPLNWQDDCPPSSTIACTRTAWGGDNHIDDSDMVFDQNDSFVENCTITVFPFFDIETVALHEFGHFGYLVHTSDSGAVMFRSYQGSRCSLRSHDIQSMNQNYVGH